MTAAPDYTVDGMIQTVLDETSSPLSQNLLTQNTVLGFLDREMRSTIVPLILSVREEYLVNFFDQPVTGQTTGYTIPQNTMGAILRDIVYVDPNGNEVGLQRLQPEQIKSVFPFGLQLPLYTFGYFLKDDQVFLYPQQATQATSYQLRMKFFRRPNNLTLQANCGQITNITGGAVTLGNTDSTWNNSTTFDVIQNFPQFNAVGDALAVSSISGSVLNFSALPSAVADGMWVCPHLMTCVPQLPYEAYDLLIQRAITRAYRATGDSQGIQTAEKLFEEYRASFVGMLDPRVQGGTKKIVNKNNTFWYGWNSPFVR